MEKFKVAIGAGHGGNNSTPGKRTPDGEYEWTFNDKVVTAAIEHLKQYENVDILRLDDATGKTDVPLKERTDKANEWGADVLVSFHHNAFKGEWGNHSGTSVYTHNDGEQPKSTKLANCVLPRIVEAYGLSNRGIKRANFHMVRESRMAAILPEGAFMDSVIDIKKMRDDNVLRNVGIAVAEGIAEYGGLKKKEVGKKTDGIEGIVIFGIADFMNVEPLAVRLGLPIYPREVAKTIHFDKLIIAGGSHDVFSAKDKVVLSGADRYETAANISEYLKGGK